LVAGGTRPKQIVHTLLFNLLFELVWSENGLDVSFRSTYLVVNRKQIKEGTKMIILIAISMIISFVIVFIAIIIYFAFHKNRNSCHTLAFSHIGELIKEKIDKSEIEKIIIESGLFKADASDWISEIILSNIDKGLKVIDLAIRKCGEPLSLEEKRQHEIRTNAKVSKQYFLSLTAEGKKDPIRATNTIVSRILHKQYLQNQKEGILKTEKLGIEMEYEFTCARDDRTCKAALALDGERFTRDEAPDLPLQDCDSEYCRCLFLFHAKGRK
jgi:hypothetical protein